MSDLLSNVLDLVRLETHPAVLARDWHNLEDLVGLAIQRNESRLAGWEVVTDIAEDLPMVTLDSTLFVQMLSNLLENTTKFTPPGTRVGSPHTSTPAARSLDTTVPRSSTRRAKWRSPRVLGMEFCGRVAPVGAKYCSNSIRGSPLGGTMNR